MTTPDPSRAEAPPAPEAEWSAGRLRRMAVSVALICAVGGALAGAWVQVDHAAPAGTFASMFTEPIVDLRLSSPTSVDSFLGSPNLAPGDRMKGTLQVYMDGSSDKDILDLDFDVRIQGSGLPAQGHRLDRSLYVTYLSYGKDDFLSGADGGFNLLRTIDGDPLLGNGDGRLSLAELAAGVNDLPPPSPESAGGTAYTIELTFQPDGPTSSTAFQGQSLHVTFVFQLADSLHADLN